MSGELTPQTLAVYRGRLLIMSTKQSFPRWISAKAYSRVSIAVLLCFFALALGTAGFSDFG
jgi:hypothetical protein